MFIITFFVYFFQQISVSDVTIYKPNILPDNWTKAFATVPNIVFALGFWFNFFPIFKGIERSSDARMKKVVLMGSLTCTVWYLAIGILGYLLTGP